MADASRTGIMARDFQIGDLPRGPRNALTDVSGVLVGHRTLTSGDVLTVFSQRDIAVPRDEQTRFATVEGEVQQIFRRPL